jgi:prepilin-type N-terminal cleavage/methylation domain-containing protein
MLGCKEAGDFTMLLTTSVRSARSRAIRRTGFTLLEVLIVVAILVILAGSASIAVFKYLDDAKEGRAKADMRQVEQALKKMYMESGGQQWPDQSMAAEVARNMDQGQAGMISPWNTPYTWQIMTTAEGNERPVISCTTNRGKQLSWPER